jgi:IS1 family transposase
MADIDSVDARQPLPEQYENRHCEACICRLNRHRRAIKSLIRVLRICVKAFYIGDAVNAYSKNVREEMSKWSKRSKSTEGIEECNAFCALPYFKTLSQVR